MFLHLRLRPRRRGVTFQVRTQYLQQCLWLLHRRVVSQDFSFAPGVEVTEIEQVKGLEFDYVVLVEVNAAEYPDTATARRLLHVGATRAVHQLWLTTVGTSSPIVREALGRPIP